MNVHSIIMWYNSITMKYLLIFSFLFLLGSVFGWILEVFFRRFVSRHKWVNPGFCSGPYLPIYGFGLVTLYALSLLENVIVTPNIIYTRLILFALMAVAMTLIEYIAGLILLKGFKMRLWDYSKRPGNIQGLICPEFSLAWALLGAAYYFLINPRIVDALVWLSHNLAFSLIIGWCLGIFTVDVIHSANVVAKLKSFADEKDIVVKIDEIKEHISELEARSGRKTSFLFPFRAVRGAWDEKLHEVYESFEEKLP